jgi:hypothetical protein
MRVFAVAIALILCCSGFSLAQAPSNSRSTSQQSAPSLSPSKPSPAELRRCTLSYKKVTRSNMADGGSPPTGGET